MSLKNVYFIILFACCREIFYQDKKKGIPSKKVIEGKFKHEYCQPFRGDSIEATIEETKNIEEPT